MNKDIIAHLKNNSFSKIEAYQVITNTLIELKNIDNLNFGTWHKLGNSLKEALEKKVEISKKEIEKNITVSNNDMPNITTYDISLWNGNSKSKEQGSISISLNKSKKSQFPSTFIFNTPLTAKQIETKQLDKNLDKIIGVIVRQFNPDFIKYGDEVVWEK